MMDVTGASRRFEYISWGEYIGQFFLKNIIFVLNGFTYNCNNLINEDLTSKAFKHPRKTRYRLFQSENRKSPENPK